MANVIPKEYQGQMTYLKDEFAFCTVIMFRHDSRDVVRSREAAKALRYLGEVETRVLAVSGGFTTEAEELLRERKVELISYDFQWTDMSQESVSVLIASKVKRPAQTSGE
ncbi:hypothetical protein EON80_14290 [bacterium]|nr:MAG: hypothetical protein EON80_14290 [bacterium]